MRDSSGLIEVFRSKAAVGIGNWVLVEGYRHLTVSLDFDGSANMTVKCVGSIGKGGATTAKDIDDAPDPTTAQTLVKNELNRNSQPFREGNLIING